MRLFDLFRKRRKRKGTRKRPGSRTSKTSRDIARLTTGLENMQTQINTTNLILQKHDNDILENSLTIKGQCEQIQNLEYLVAAATSTPENLGLPLVNRPHQAPVPSIMQRTGPSEDNQKFDISRFTEQEKRILAVFFQSQGMALSYADIAQWLDKSHHTVKNQMNQIRAKTDLFTWQTDNENRKIFRLKDGLKIEKYLNIHRPVRETGQTGPGAAALKAVQIGEQLPDESA